MPKKSHAKIAEENGVTRDIIKKISAKGVNVYDKDALAEALKDRRPRVPQDAVMEMPDGDKSDRQTLASLKELLLTTEDRDTAVIVKEKALAFKNLIAAEKEEGLLLARKIVEEEQTKIGTAVRAAFDKLGNDLPGRCAGCTESEILSIYEGLKLDILKGLADGESDFWRTLKERK
jgi:hypothetical protein